MPNWCSNQLFVEGEKKQLDAFLEFIKGYDDEGMSIHFSFESIDKTPPELLAMPSPVSHVEQDKNAIEAENVKKYNAKDWYEWRKNHWGTKWNLDKNAYTKRYSSKKWAISFDTAWTPPIPIIERLAEKFPDLKMELKYCEPSLCFAGVFKAYKGALIDDAYNDGLGVDKKKYEKLAIEFGFREWLE